MIRYDRSPSPRLRALLRAGALLSPLLVQRRVAGLALDVQLREEDHLHVYCGLTRLLDVFVRPRGTVAVAAEPFYRQQDCGTGLFRDWSPSEDGFAQALEKYLRGVEVAARYVLKEGAVQHQWSAVRDPWIPFDREAVLGYADTSTRVAGRRFSCVDSAWREVGRLAANRPWARRKPNAIGAELDQLAVDDEGRLVLLELKFGKASAGSVYHSPLQLLQYAHEWADAYPQVKSALQALIEARQHLGLSPKEMKPLGDRLRPVIGFGSDVPRGEVRARLDKVCEIANRHRPAIADRIEVWALEGDKPQRLA